MNYCDIVLNKHAVFNTEFNDIIFERMEIESDFIMTCLESYQIVIEEAQVQNTQKAKSFWERIKEFFAKLFGIFSEKTKTMYQQNKEWMDNNFNKLDKIDYTNLKIEMLPFWKMTLDKIKSESSRLSAQMFRAMNNPANMEKYANMDAVKKDFYTNYVSENGDIANGLKNFYRVGTAKGPLNVEQLEGDALKKMVVGEFKDYCFNYHKDIIPYVESLMQGVEKELKKIEDVMKSKVTKESFCLVENTQYSNTELIYCNNSVVLEAEQNSQQQQQKEDSNKNTNNNTTAPTKVNLVNSDDKKQDEDPSTELYKGMSSNQLAFMKNVMQINQISVSALMTVVEERFIAYMNAMKAIVNAAGQNATNVPK